MNKISKFIIFLLVLGSYIFLNYIDIFSAEYDHSQQSNAQWYAFAIPYHAEIMTVLGLLGFLLGAAVYVGLDAELRKKTQDVTDASEILIKFFEPTQKKIVLFLSEKNGSAYQRELSHIPGLDKLKVHRALKTLLQKGIITIDKHGKINKIHLEKNTHKLLQKLT